MHSHQTSVNASSALMSRHLCFIFSKFSNCLIKRVLNKVTIPGQEKLTIWNGSGFKGLRKIYVISVPHLLHLLIMLCYHMHTKLHYHTATIPILHSTLLPCTATPMLPHIITPTISHTPLYCHTHTHISVCYRIYSTIPYYLLSHIHHSTIPYSTITIVHTHATLSLHHYTLQNDTGPWPNAALYHQTIVCYHTTINHHKTHDL